MAGAVRDLFSTLESFMTDKTSRSRRSPDASDAYTAADKLTKPAWLGITGGACALLLLNLVVPGSMLFYLIGLVAIPDSEWHRRRRATRPPFSAQHGVRAGHGGACEALLEPR